MTVSGADVDLGAYAYRDQGRGGTNPGTDIFSEHSVQGLTERMYVSYVVRRAGRWIGKSANIEE